MWLADVLDAVDQQGDELADGDPEVLGVVDAEAGVGGDASGEDAGQAGRSGLGRAVNWTGRRVSMVVSIGVSAALVDPDTTA